MDLLFYILIGFGLVYSLMTYLAVRREKRSQGRDIRPFEAVPVTVFKPLKGLDGDLKENLRTFFELDYPRYELIFGVDNDRDPAIDIVNELQNEYPQIEAHLVINSSTIGYNPKVNNLYNMYPYANYDYLVINDSNVRVNKNYLLSMMRHATRPDVGLVTSTVMGFGARSIGAIFENMHLNSFIAGNAILITRLLKIPVTIGKSMCFRREILEKIGGFRFFSDYLLEDGLLGRTIQKENLKLVITSDYVTNFNREWSVKHFLNRHLRWAVMRRQLNFGHYFAEVFSNPIFIAALYLVYKQTPEALALFGLVNLVKILSDFALDRLFKTDMKLKQYLLLPAKDLIIGVIWFLGLFRKTVNWRGNKFILAKDTKIKTRYTGYRLRPAFVFNYLFRLADLTLSGSRRVKALLSRAYLF